MTHILLHGEYKNQKSNVLIAYLSLTGSISPFSCKTAIYGITKSHIHLCGMTNFEYDDLNIETFNYPPIHL